MCGIRDLITCGAPPPRRAAPDFADPPVAPSNKDTLVNVAADPPEPVDRATAREEIRAPPVTPKPPPPSWISRGDENCPTMDATSDYQLDWNEDLYSSGWTWNRNRDRSTRKGDFYFGAFFLGQGWICCHSAVSGFFCFAFVFLQRRAGLAMQLLVPRK